jgi:hypothetical protein
MLSTSVSEREITFVDGARSYSGDEIIGLSWGGFAQAMHIVEYFEASLDHQQFTIGVRTE